MITQEASPSRCSRAQAAYQEEGGRHPRPLLALAALEVAGRGDKVTMASILKTLLGTVDSGGGGYQGHDANGGSTALGAGSRGSGGGGGVRPTGVRVSFGSIARLSLGGVNV